MPQCQCQLKLKTKYPSAIIVVREAYRKRAALRALLPILPLLTAPIPAACLLPLSPCFLLVFSMDG